MPTSVANKSNNTFLNILWIGLLTGTLDALAAIIWSKKVVVLFQYIASGVFGKAAFAGSNRMVLWGILFHYIIAYSCTVVLYLMYPSFIKVLKNKYVTAVVFALITWLVTNLVIVPLSQIGWKPMHVNSIIIGFLILIVTIGLPTALIADRHYSRKKRD